MSLYRYVMDRPIFSQREFDPVRWQRNIVGSRNLIERYELKALLKGHSGCVNSVLFSEEGRHIYTGSDDTNVNIYLAETAEMVDSFSTIHTNNIFYARDLPGSDMNIIITCAADGRVALTNAINKNARKIYRHRGRAHRIALVPGETSQFYSCGEDGTCCLFDLRDSTTAIFDDDNDFYGGDEDMCTPVAKTGFYNNRQRKCSIYTVGVNPMNNYQVAIGGSSSHIALYDSRKFESPVAYLCPRALAVSSAHVTGLKYDHTGELLIGSYNDEDVYSFLVKEHSVSDRRRPTASSGGGDGDDDDDVDDTGKKENNDNNNDDDWQSTTGLAADVARGYYRSYTGHRNSNTVKQVSFLGARSEYVVSGSDCGHLFIWSTHTSETIQMLHADAAGAINCLATHNHLPILASSGLENDAKIWVPTGEHQPIAEGTEKQRQVSRIAERNSDRNNDRDEYNAGLLQLLVSLLNRGDLPLHDDSDDDFDEDEEEEEEEEEEGDDDDGNTAQAGNDHEPSTATGGDSQASRWRRRSSGRTATAAATSTTATTSTTPTTAMSSRTTGGSSGSSSTVRRINWTQLARVLPALLGRRRRRPAAADDSEEEEEEEEDHDDDDGDVEEDGGDGDICADEMFREEELMEEEDGDEEIEIGPQPLQSAAAAAAAAAAVVSMAVPVALLVVCRITAPLSFESEVMLCSTAVDEVCIRILFDAIA